MDLPGEILQLIGEFVLTFPKLKNYRQGDAKKYLARSLVSSYAEYIDYINENFKIPFFNDFKQCCKEAIINLHNEADSAIKEHDLEDYRDIIIENYSLTIPKLINIAEYCFAQTKDISKVCDIYCKLGYPKFDYRNGNEDYLINFINNWVDFATHKGCSKNAAQLGLLLAFEKIDNQDHGRIFDIKENKGLRDFFPFTIENVENLVDFILEFDYFDSYEYKDKIGVLVTEEEEYNSKSYLCVDETPRYSLLCNYYVYIFNKANDEYPLSAFAVCVYSKWLNSNISIISQFLPELSQTELRSLILDYSLEKYSDITSIPEYDPMASLIKGLSNSYNQDEEEIELLYKLYYRTEISKFELTDIWYYFVVNKVLTYKHHLSQDTAAILQVSEIEYVEDGYILLPWKYVRFVDGKAFFYHPNHEKGENARLPFKLEFDKAQKSFMEICKSILWNFPFIVCRVENGRIVEIDEDFAKYVINDIAYFQKFQSRRRISLNYSSYTAKEILLRYKSQQLNFLENKQLKQFEIIPIIENASNSSIQREEPALLFTIGSNTNTYTLVFENSYISRASYIFIIERNCYDAAVKIIASFFTSNKVNKRAELQYSRDMFNKADGFLRVIRVPHDNNSNWEYSINFYSK